MTTPNESNTMKSTGTLLTALLLVPLSVLQADEAIRSSAEVKVLTTSSHFHTAQPLYSTLTAQAPQAEFAAPADATKGFTLKLTANLKKFDAERIIIEIPQVLTVRLRQHDPLERQRQNYLAFKMPDGSVPVLEASAVP